MANLMDAIREDTNGGSTGDAKFPHAPDHWATQEALVTAQQEGLKLGEEHWEAIRALQEYFARNAEKPVNLRTLHDALEEKFHENGGIKHLYQIFPGGPVLQGCRMAGLEPPTNASSKGFGSVS